MAWLRHIRPMQVGAVLLGIVIAWFAIRAAAIGMLGGLGDASNLSLVAQAPSVTDVTLRRLATGRLDREAALQLDARARNLLAESPLAFNAVFASAMAKAKLGDDAAAERLMRLAIARDPRNRVARSWLVGKALPRRQFDDALTQLDAIMRMQPDLAVPITRVMVGFLVAPGMVEAFAKSAERGAPWMPAFLDAARRDDRVARQVYALTLRLAQQGDDVLPAASAQQVIQSAVSRGDLRDARNLLLATNPAARSNPSNLLIDSAFQLGSQGGDFAWHMAEPLPDGATVSMNQRLDVALQSADRGELLGQDVIAGPGSYRLVVVLHSTTAEVQGALHWQVQCRRTGEIISSTPVPANAVVNAELTAQFEAGPTCGLPRISLVNVREGAVGSAEISRIALVRVP